MRISFVFTQNTVTNKFTTSILNSIFIWQTTVRPMAYGCNFNCVDLDKLAAFKRSIRTVDFSEFLKCNWTMWQLTMYCH